MIIYFAHTWNIHAQIKVLISSLRRALPHIVIIDPFELNDEGQQTVGVRQDNIITDTNAKQIIKDDKQAIDDCDVVFAFYTDNSRSIGTTLEIAYANRIKKDVVLITDKQDVYDHIWFRSYCKIRRRCFPNRLFAETEMAIKFYIKEQKAWNYTRKPK